MAKAKSDSNERPVIVTTEHRGVFFGYGDDKMWALKRVIVAEVKW